MSPPDPSTNYIEALERRHVNTGLWFLQSSEYTSWKTERSSFLWLRGNAGCGKTILSSAIIEDLKKDQTPTKDILFFYFTFTDSNKQSLQDAVRSLAMQLCRNREGARKCLDSLFSECGRGAEQPTLTSLKSTFREMLKVAGDVYMVIDALDESGNHRLDLLAWIRDDLLRDGLDNVHVLVTSRSEKDIQSAIESEARTKVVSLGSDRINKDIATYIRAQVEESPQLERWRRRPDVQNEIADALQKKADGVYDPYQCFTQFYADRI